MRERIETSLPNDLPTTSGDTRARVGWKSAGNHTDYNEGTVLSVAVDRRYTWLPAGPEPTLHAD